MTTPDVAQAALIHVGQVQFAANANDPTYGVMYQTTRWLDMFPVDTFNWPTVAIYRLSGQAVTQGLGFSTQHRYPVFRVDVFGRNKAEADKAIEALRLFWIADFDFLSPTGAVGQGYLRLTGGIKTLDIGEARAAPWEKTGVIIRRLADVTVMVED